MNKRRFTTLLACAAVGIPLISQAPAAVLLSDTFPGSALDGGKYATDGGKIGDIVQTGGELIITAGSEIYPRIGTVNPLPDNVEVTADIRLIDVGSTNNWESNTGFRLNCHGWDSTGVTAEIFTWDGGSNATSKIKRRNPPNWGSDVQTANLASVLTAGQVVTLKAAVNSTANTLEITLTDKATAQVLATLSTTSSNGNSAGGILMLGSYGLKKAAYQHVTVKANGGAGAVVFEDDFEGPAIDPAKWQSYPNTVAFVTVTDGVARLNGDDPFNLAGDFAFLPTKQAFGDFDLQAVFKLTDKTDSNDVARPDAFFGIRFREVNSASGYYEVIVWPNDGYEIPDTGVFSPAYALVAADDPSTTTYEFISGPIRFNTPAGQGGTLVVNIKAEGDNLLAFLGPNKTKGDWPTVSGTRSTLGSGVLDFHCVGMKALDLDEYTVWSAGTGGLPDTPTPPTRADNCWAIYE